jgi:hypothetical protein
MAGLNPPMADKYLDSRLRGNDKLMRGNDKGMRLPRPTKQASQ